MPEGALNKNGGETIAKSPKDTMIQLHAMSPCHLLTHELPIQISEFKYSDGV
jgi:hypothetical protein